MQMNKRGLTFSAAFILAIKNNDLLANPSSTYWASRASSAWAICSLSVFCCFSLTHPSFPFSPSHSASFTPCRPPESERQAFETLNLTKLIFRRRRRTTAFPPFFLRVSSWDSADILRWKKYVIFGVVVGGGRGTPESCLNSECKIFRRESASHVGAWQLSMSSHWQNMTSYPLIISHCAPRGVSSH